MWKCIGNRIIWPHKYLTWQSQMICVLTLVSIIIGRGIYQLVNHSTFYPGLFVSLYMSAVIACYLYDKDLPIGTVSFDFEPNNLTNQYRRLAITSLSSVIYTVCILKGVS